MFTTTKSWDDARSECQNDGADLASVTSSEENSFVTTFTHSPAWLGGYLDGSEWKWTDGSTFDYTNWDVGEPNNSGGNQDRIQTNWGIIGIWDDGPTTNLNTFICEKPS